MSRREAEQFEEQLQRVARGESVEEQWAPLVETALQATSLAEPPAPPPNQLLPGRQRLLAEAAQLRARTAKSPKARVRMMGTMRAATALIAVVLVFGLVFGVGQAAASSLPGEALYGLKLATEEVRLAVTTNPQAKADLSLVRAQKRLEEITTLLMQGQAVDSAVPQRLEQQLMTALRVALQASEPTQTLALQQLETMIQRQQQTMAAVMARLGPREQALAHQLLRVLERVRQEVLAGQGGPNGTRNRLHQGIPLGPPVLPNPSRTPHPQTTPKHGEPRPTEQPGRGPGPAPTREPAGPMPTEQPGHRPGPRPTEAPGHSPGPQPTEGPVGPMPTDPPGNGPGPQPTEKPVGPAPTDLPGQGPGPQSTPEPGGPMPTDPPGTGPGPQPTKGQSQSPDPQPTMDPGKPAPTTQPGSGGKGGGSEKP